MIHSTLHSTSRRWHNALLIAGCAFTLIRAYSANAQADVGSAPPLTLRALLDSVRANHPMVRAGERRVLAAQGSRITARAFGNPIVSYQVYQTPFPGGRPLPDMQREAMTTATFPLAGPLSTYRTDWQQDSLFEIGRSDDEIDLARMGYKVDHDFDGNIVTKAMAGESAHDFGYAVDLALEDGSEISKNKHTPISKKLRELSKDSLTWGLTWPDTPHFELPNWKVFKSKPCSWKP